MSIEAPRHLFRALRSVWLWPALATLLLGLYRIGTPELWRDEISSWSAATRALTRLAGILGNVDASNGAYYLMLHAWTDLFGDSVPSLRLPSALAMSGAAAFTALAALRWFGSRMAAVAAGLLLAALPNVSAYAQEARSYAIVTCAVAAATWCLLRALERPGLGRWAWYGLCMALAGVFHLVSLAGLAGQFVVVAVHFWSVRDRRVLWQFPAAALTALLPALPVMLLGRRQSGRQLEWITPATRYKLRMFWPEFLGSFGVLYAFLALAVAALLWRGHRTAAVQAAALAVLPVLGVWLVSQGRSSYFVDRYLLFTLPAWAALAGGGVGALDAALRRIAPRRTAAVAALAAVAVPALLGMDQQRVLRQVTARTATDYRGAAAAVAAGYRPGDGIVAAGGRKAWMMVGPGVAYHLPGDVRPRPLFVARTAVRADDLFPVECPVPAACIGDVSRTWVVTIGTGDDPYQGLPAGQAKALQAVFTPAEVRHVRGLTVSLLVRATQHA
ncbi:glycosyltransferase family 39 protein [Kitasatospora sp. GP82]|uniref:glycosyltransferase family 39 protein n=1 Tax=Kitasatospora sp. GP82 TaxID=3035089 RepID=UPI002477273B|nr:glycosyltransferase family 39 protein [Kitasatospora sp. GP82]MDH6127968.1 mannosyltransferase [Kitasatospora sp. GP82]